MCICSSGDPETDAAVVDIMCGVNLPRAREIVLTSGLPPAAKVLLLQPPRKEVEPIAVFPLEILPTGDAALDAAIRSIRTMTNIQESLRVVKLSSLPRYVKDIIEHSAGCAGCFR